MEERDELGRWKPGFCPNPNGKPSDKEYVKLVRKTFGDNLEGIFFLKMALTSGKEPKFTEVKKFINFIQDPEVKKRFKKFLKSTGLEKAGGGIKGKFSSIKISDILTILDGIENRVYGKPVQHNIEEITTPEPIEIKIEFVKSQEPTKDLKG